MIRSFFSYLCAVYIIILIPDFSWADETMDQIERSGKIRVGWRKSSIPFAYLDSGTGKHIGFSVDMTHLLVDRLSLYFGKKIDIDPYVVTSKTRISMVADRKIHIEMGSTTHTQKRDEIVDFSLVFFFSETTFLVTEASGIKKIDDLNGRRLGAIRGSTNLAAIQTKIADGVFSPAGQIVETASHTEGFNFLEASQIDAYCTDRSILGGLKMKASNPENWRIVDFAIAYEPYGYMVWEGNSDIRDFIDNTIIWAIKTGKFFEIYDKWMGPDGVVPIPRSRAYMDYLQLISYPQQKDWWKKQ